MTNVDFKKLREIQIVFNLDLENILKSIKDIEEINFTLIN